MLVQSRSCALENEASGNREESGLLWSYVNARVYPTRSGLFRFVVTFVRTAMLDREKFIKLVHEKECLWDPNDSGYHLRDHQRIIWDEIAEEMNAPGKLIYFFILEK